MDASDGLVGKCLPSWQLHVALGLACALTIGTTMRWSEPSAFHVVILVASAVAVVIHPRSHAATIFLGIVAFTVLVNDPGLSLWIIPTVTGVHATHTLAALVAVVPWGSKVEWPALIPSLHRFWIVQAASQLLVVVALLLSA
ncbi:hypothetical protein EF847_16775 [Actinobacteria bacterium YIM 96077]|uniref:Uncharacterized protein n=2 Tax=Phytoactinopolyspora halophila TaxID=1981511 RepID=A0A329QCH8_9ACTN|nr:hypothetical protein EF847_16775 [Actinobacteria bacterium YIM 96077]RAW09957.1 hypothetical protein DPM12_19940 [Phytoactinopolyspora halophila]